MKPRILFCLFFFIFSASVSRAEGLFRNTDAPQERWSLAEWLQQRDRMRLMDLWLAIHSPNPYDLYVGANFQTGSSTGGAYYSAWNFQAAAYASIFGLELQKEFNPVHDRWIPMFLLRLFGKRVQGTNITIQLGAKNETWDAGQLWNLLAGVDLNIYITRFFGVDALYRHYFKSSVSPTIGKISGDRYELGAFIDYKFLRIYGMYFDEVQSQEGLTSVTQSGPELGFRLFF